MTLAEFMNWQAIASKGKWDVEVHDGQAIVSAPESILRYYGYLD